MNSPNKTSSFSSFSIIVVFIIFILIGIPLAYVLNFELNPNTRSSSLSVSFSWNNAEPKIIEEKVTSKLEALITQVQGINRINSSSGNGEGRVSVIIDKNADIEAIRFQISSLIRQLWADLPSDVSYPQLAANYPDREYDRPVLTYTLSAPVTPSYVKEYANNYLKPLLASVKGVRKVEITGGATYGWQIEFDYNKINSIGIKPEDIIFAVKTGISKENLGIGFLSTPFGNTVSANINDSSLIPVILQTSIPVNHSQNIEEYLLSIPVKKNIDRIIYLYDIAKIAYVEEPQYFRYRINGQNTINILIYPADDVNNLVVAKKVRFVIQEFQKTSPSGYEVLLNEDSTRYLSHELQNIITRSMLAFIILMLFIFLVTRKWKYAILILTMLIGNLSIAIIFYYIFRIELHLYALAGITVSFGLMTDNIIIMSEHFRIHGNRKVLLAILAGTMAVISSLIIIFFLDEQVKANLVDFAMVVIINQSVSLFTALSVIPAIVEKIGLNIPTKNKPEYVFAKNLKIRRTIKLTAIYMKIIGSMRKRKTIFIAILILGFGTPVYLLPDKLEGNKWFNRAYNSSLGNEWYKANVKPSINKYLGGTLRLFAEKVFSGSYFTSPEETYLFIGATMPKGTTLNQADALIIKMEDFLKQYKEISIFESNITPRNSSITIHFNENFKNNEFPYTLKTNVVNRAVELGGAYWSVQGFGDGFNNSVYETTGNYAIKVSGYNYDRLMLLATNLKSNLERYERVKEIFIVSERSWYKPDNTEFIAQVNKEISTRNTNFRNTYNTLQNWSISSFAFAEITNVTKLENLRLIPEEYLVTDLWKLSKMPFYGDSGIYRFGNTFSISQQLNSPVIIKEDQQYIMFLQFEFVGADKSARSYINKTLSEFKDEIPLGYNAYLLPDNRFLWGEEVNGQYWLLLLVFVMIFFICSILFESLVHPFAVLLIIPVSYIGIFLTFYVFRLNFDQGGFAALLILSGLTVNSAIYILNDFNNLKRLTTKRSCSDFRLYFKAFNYKIIPILLTIVSTVLGFIPFLIGEKQTFWYALAAGSIGGIIFSLIGIVFYLPLFLKLKD